MTSVRLRPDQIRRLRDSGNGAAMIRYALRRWARGDFVIGQRKKRQKDDELLQIFPLWRSVPVEDWQLREILDAHWRIPDEKFLAQCRANIARLDRQIADQMRALPAYSMEATE